MANSNSEVRRCVHGMRSEHIVSGNRSTCIGPFEWLMTVSEAASISGYYLDYAKYGSRRG